MSGVAEEDTQWGGWRGLRRLRGRQAPGEWAGKPGPWQPGSHMCALPEPGIVRDGAPRLAFLRPAPPRSEPILNPPQADSPSGSSSEAASSGRLAQHATRLTGHSLGLPSGPGGRAVCLLTAWHPLGVPTAIHGCPPVRKGFCLERTWHSWPPGPSWAWSVPTRSSPSLFWAAARLSPQPPAERVLEGPVGVLPADGRRLSPGVCDRHGLQHDRHPHGPWGLLHQHPGPECRQHYLCVPPGPGVVPL